MKASILAVGTEITTGQILNKNAQWLSTQLNRLGFEIKFHLTVPDLYQDILSSLHFLEKECDLLIVTGGLGPTADDFTRKVISEWTQQELIFDDKSYQHVTAVLTSRGQPLRDIQKQQCFFPRNSVVLTNNAGTANAFTLNFKNLEVFVLPGPPNEIETLWRDSIETLLTSRVPEAERTQLRSWDTLGLGESEIAVKVEPLFEKFKFESGYRVHRPYVEVKLYYQKSRESEALKLSLAIDERLKDVIISKNGDDPLDELMRKLKGKSVILRSNIYFPELLKRFLPGFEKYKIQFDFLTSITAEDSARHSSQNSIDLNFNFISADEVEIAGQLFKNPYATTQASEFRNSRFKAWVIEKAIIHWAAILPKSERPA